MLRHELCGGENKTQREFNILRPEEPSGHQVQHPCAVCVPELHHIIVLSSVFLPESKLLCKKNTNV